MQWGILVPISAIIGGPIIWAFNNWTRARYGQPMERYEGEFEKQDGERACQIALLSSDNERQAAQIGRLEERIAVLERIVTDPAERTAREIDALRAPGETPARIEH